MNSDLIEQFSILKKYYSSKADKGRSIAYERAISGIRTVGNKIVNISQVKGVRGIGETITSKIKEYLETGSIEAVENVKEEIRESKKMSLRDTMLEKFETIWGVGPQKAKELYDIGIRDFEELDRKKNSLLTRSQIIGLKYREELLLPVARTTITALYVVMRAILNVEYRGNYQMAIAGSYRRGAKYSGDVDCVVTSEYFSLEDFVKLLQAKGIVTDVLSMRGEKFMGIAHCPTGFGNHFRLDIEFVDRSEFGSTLLYFTGSKGTNIYMRSEAKRKGMILSQHGLICAKTGKKVLESPTEEDIFKRLGIPFIIPENR